MFRPLLAAALAILPLPAVAQDADDASPPVLLFACGTGADALEGMLKLVAQPRDDGSFGPLQLVEESHGHNAAPRPDAGGAERRFRFSISDGPDGYFFDIVTDHGEDAWHIFSVNVAATEPDEADSFEAGLAIVDVAGKLTRYVPCEEARTAYLADLAPLMDCDENNPVGPAACNIYNEPMRSERLLQLYPWLDQVMPADWAGRQGN